MNIRILATGSRGDVQPYIALGLELKKAGQNVSIVSFENYESFVKGYGLDFIPIQGDVSQAASSEAAKGAHAANNPLKVLLSFRKLQGLIFNLQRDFFTSCSGADLIVYHPGNAIGYFAAQKMGIPSVLATPFPMTPTREFPALIFYNAPRMGKTANLLTHRIFEQIMWFASKDPIRKFWRSEFKSSPPNFGNPFAKQTTAALPTIISCSNYVFPRPKDWPDNVHSDGYWFLNEGPAWEPSEDLLRFLQDGEPPVYVGFGSLSNSETSVQTTALITEALNRSGKLGILATGWNGMVKAADLPKSIFTIESAPHSWLFPRMSVVVHHGGAGTTAAGLRAGIPSVIIPHSNDQFAWGRRLFELGVSPRPIPRNKLTVETLAEAITLANSPIIRERARDLGSRIQQEKGAEAAANIILDCLQRTAR